MCSHVIHRITLSVPAMMPLTEDRLATTCYRDSKARMTVGKACMSAGTACMTAGTARMTAKQARQQAKHA